MSVDAVPVTEGFLPVPGGNVWYRRVGYGGVPLLLVHGGPGVPSDLLFDAFTPLAQERQVVFYDQLGCGRSDRPDDTSLWQLDRFVDELGAVLDGLGLVRPHVYGHSWGAMLGFEYAVRHQPDWRSFIASNGPADMSRAAVEIQDMIRSQGEGVLEMIIAHEEAGTLDDPEYGAAITRHINATMTRERDAMEAMSSGLEGTNYAVVDTMLGRDWNPTGNLRDWTVLDRLHRITVPTLVLGGEFDEITPSHQAEVHRRIPGAELRIVPGSGHMAYIDGPDVVRRYLAEITGFLNRIEAAEVSRA